MKRYDEYDYNESVFEGSVCVGTVVSMAEHPYKVTVGFILVRNEASEYTIFRCQKDARCGPFITRRVPAAVMRIFSREVLGTTDVAVDGRPFGIRKYPVLALAPRPVDQPHQQLTDQDLPVQDLPIQDLPVQELRPEVGTKAPYFDFV